MSGREYVHLGASPAEEPCVGIHEHDYELWARPECERFIARIREVCGVEPPGARLVVKAFSHEFGTYFEVVCEYEADAPAAEAYAWELETKAPTRWHGGC